MSETCPGPIVSEPRRALPPCVARRWPRLLALFRGYVRGYLARHFHAVRASRSGPAPAIPPGPLIVVVNHPSWWDPLIGILLTGTWPDRAHYAPMEAKALANYRFFERLGFFAIEPGTVQGGLTLIRTFVAKPRLDAKPLMLNRI